MSGAVGNLGNTKGDCSAIASQYRERLYIKAQTENTIIRSGIVVPLPDPRTRLKIRNANGVA